MRDRIREQLETAYLRRDCSFVSARWSESDGELTARLNHLRDRRRDPPAEVDWDASPPSLDEGVQLVGGDMPLVSSDDSEMGEEEISADEVFEDLAVHDPAAAVPIGGNPPAEVAAVEQVYVEPNGYDYVGPVDSQVFRF